MIARQSQLHFGLELRRLGRRPKRLTTQQRHLVQALPGVGPKTAYALLEQFCSARGVFAASAAELAEVPGLGRKKAEAISRLLDLVESP